MMTTEFTAEQEGEALEWMLAEGRRLPASEAERFAFMVNTHSVVAPITLAKMLGIKAQVLYTYMRSDRLEWVLTESGKKVIPLKAAVAYVAARRVREAEKQAKIEAELNGEEA
jgi:hypothetical protein